MRRSLSRPGGTFRILNDGRVVLGLAVLAGLAAAYVLYGAAVVGEKLYSTSSPDGKSKIEIVQTRDLIIGRSVYLTARRNGKTTVNRKLLYTGDFLDDDFRGLYPNPTWTSNSTLELGYSDASPDERSSELKVVNETSSPLAYVLIESSLRKVVILDVEPKSTVYQRFQVRGWLSCEGRYAESNERFGGAASVVGNIGQSMGYYDARGRFVIRIRGSETTIESPQLALQSADCCAPDRPDYKHE